MEGSWHVPLALVHLHSPPSLCESYISSRELPACGAIVDSRSGEDMRISESLLSYPSLNVEQSAVLTNAESL